MSTVYIYMIITSIWLSRHSVTSRKNNVCRLHQALNKAYKNIKKSNQNKIDKYGRSYLFEGQDGIIHGKMADFDSG